LAEAEARQNAEHRIRKLERLISASLPGRSPAARERDGMFHPKPISLESPMFRRNHQSQKTIAPPGDRPFDDFHEWILSLPWVVERPYSLGTPGVRSFGVECEPLGRRALWLLTGLQSTNLSRTTAGIAVIVPTEAADEIEAVGWGRSVAPMPDRHKLVAVFGDLAEKRTDVEALVLTAYGCAMS
jgi:hypothetical protein